MAMEHIPCMLIMKNPNHGVKESKKLKLNSLPMMMMTLRMTMLVKLTKEQQLTVKRLFDRFKNNLSDKSYLKFRKRVHKAIGFNGEYDMRVLTIDEVNLTFGIETDGYGHT